MQKTSIACLILSALFVCASPEGARAEDDPPFCTDQRKGVPSEWLTPAARLISFFETSEMAGYGAISGDFDCQGVSVGVLQWNAGKGSLGTLIESIHDRDPEKYAEIMGPYASELLRQTKRPETALQYVRSFQVIPAPANCGRNRSADWSEKGLDFAKRLSDLAASEAGKAEQQKRISRKMAVAWNYAHWWVDSDPARKSNKEEPTSWETTFFADTLTFNGCFYKTANHETVQKFLKEHGPDGAKSTIVKYLRGTPKPEVDQFQPTDAKESATIIEKAEISDKQLRLLVFAYLTATNLKKFSSAATFRYNTIIRRATIILGEGHVNGREIKSGLVP